MNVKGSFSFWPFTTVRLLLILLIAYNCIKRVILITRQVSNIGPQICTGSHTFNRVPTLLASQESRFCEYILDESYRFINHHLYCQGSLLSQEWQTAWLVVAAAKSTFIYSNEIIGESQSIFCFTLVPILVINCFNSLRFPNYQANSFWNPSAIARKCVLQKQPEITRQGSRSFKRAWLDRLLD